MAFDLGAVVAKIKLDTQNFKSGIKEVQDGANDLKGKLDNLSGSLKNAGSKMTLFATTPIALASAGMVKLAGDAAETQNRFDAVFGSLSEGANKFADDLANATGRSRVALRDGLASFQGFSVGMGLSAEEAKNMSYRLQELAIDFGSFNNLSDEESIQRFISAMSGSSEVLDRFGINIKQANLELKLQEMGLAESALQATEAEKAMARFAIIEETMGEQGAIGDAIKTQDSFANSLKRTQAEFQDLSIQIGEILLPIAQDLIVIVRQAIEWFSGLTEGQKKAILVVVGLVAAIGPLLLIIGSLISIISTAITIFGVISGVIAAIASGPILILIAAIAALGFAWTKMSDESKQKVKDAISFIVDKLQSMVNFMFRLGGDIIRALVGPFEDAFNKIKDIVNQIRDKLDFTKRQSPSVIDLIKNGVKEANKAFDGLDFNLDANKPQVAAALSGPGMGNVGISIDMRGATVGDMTQAQAIGEAMGDSIIKKLQNTVRF